MLNAFFLMTSAPNYQANHVDHNHIQCAVVYNFAERSKLWAKISLGESKMEKKNISKNWCFSFVGEYLNIMCLGVCFAFSYFHGIFSCAQEEEKGNWDTIVPVHKTQNAIEWTCKWLSLWSTASISIQFYGIQLNVGPMWSVVISIWL